MKKHFMALLCLVMSTLSLYAAGDEVWITLATEDLPDIREAFAERDWPVQAIRHKTHQKVTIMKVTEEQIPVISLLLHETNHRCGGFVAHPSYTMAIAEAQRDLLRSSPNSVVSKRALTYSLDRATEVNTVLSDLSETNLRATITSLSSYTTRYYTSSTSVDASNWLKGQWETIAGARSDISVNLYNHTWAQPSVIMTITGAHQPQDIVVIGAHLDSINQSGSVAPGADDDASGVATFTESIRAALANGYVPARTVKFIAYAAEEVGLRGSADIASAALSAGDNVIGVLQLDMTNYNGSSTDIVLMQDYTNSGQNTFMENLIDTYTGASRGTDNCGYGCSDHASWHNRGFATSMPFESYMNQYNPNIHTANDTLSVSGNNANHAMNFARLCVSYIIELAKGGLNNNPGPDPGPVGGGGGGGPTELQNNETLSGLGDSQGGEDHYFIEVPAGATDLSVTTSGGSGDVDLYVRQGSQATTSTYDCRPYENGNNENCGFASTTAGRYYILLHAYSTYSNLTLSVSYTGVGANNPPSASFTSSTSDLTASFSDTSTDSDGSITARSWNFGDSATSTSQNPSHIYAAAGTYTVTLTVTDNDGATDSTSSSVTVTDSPANIPPSASFTHSVSDLTANFTDTSTDSDGSVTSWFWDFGDSSSSSQQNSSHTYAAAGSYTVTLTATDNNGAQDTAALTVTVTDPNPGDTELSNGETASGLGTGTGTWLYYTIVLPSGASNLQIDVAGSNGDADLYLRLGSQPTTSTNDCQSTSSNSNESCTVSSPGAGVWHIGIYAYSTYSNLSVTASFTEPSQGCDPGGWTETGLSGASGSWQHFTLTVPACTTNLNVAMSGGSGDADMYVRFGGQPTTSNYDCRPYKNGNTETCDFPNPGTGTWYISIRAYSSYSNVTVNASFQ